ncbi:MAG: ATP-binding protein, partial [Woeseiaceae bacterium]
GDEGSGLGLAIVKRLCERYGWRVEVASTVGQGSRFDIIMREP